MNKKRNARRKKNRQVRSPLNAPSAQVPPVSGVLGESNDPAPDSANISVASVVSNDLSSNGPGQPRDGIEKAKVEELVASDGEDSGNEVLTPLFVKDIKSTSISEVLGESKDPASDPENVIAVSEDLNPEGPDQRRNDIEKAKVEEMLASDGEEFGNEVRAPLLASTAKSLSVSDVLGESEDTASDSKIVSVVSNDLSSNGPDQRRNDIEKAKLEELLGSDGEEDFGNEVRIPLFVKDIKSASISDVLGESEDTASDSKIVPAVSEDLSPSGPDQRRDNIGNPKGKKLLASEEEKDSGNEVRTSLLVNDVKSASISDVLRESEDPVSDSKTVSAISNDLCSNGPDQRRDNIEKAKVEKMLASDGEEFGNEVRAPLLASTAKSLSVSDVLDESDDPASDSKIVSVVSNDVSSSGPGQQPNVEKAESKELLGSDSEEDSGNEVRVPLFVSTAKSTSISDVLGESKDPASDSENVVAVSEDLSPNAPDQRRDNIGKAVVKELLEWDDEETSGNEVLTPLFVKDIKSASISDELEKSKDPPPNSEIVSAVSGDLSTNGPDQPRDGIEKAKVEELVASDGEDSGNEVRAPLFVSTAKTLSVSDVLGDSEDPASDPVDVPAVAEDLSSNGPDQCRNDIGKAKVEELLGSDDEDSGNEVRTPSLVKDVKSASISDVLGDSEDPASDPVDVSAVAEDLFSNGPDQRRDNIGKAKVEELLGSDDEDSGNEVRTPLFIKDIKSASISDGLDESEDSASDSEIVSAVSEDLTTNGPDQRRNDIEKSKLKKMVASNGGDSGNEVRAPLFVSTAKSLSVCDVLGESKDPASDPENVVAVSEDLNPEGPDQRRNDIEMSKSKKMVASDGKDSGNEVLTPLFVKYIKSALISDGLDESNDLASDSKIVSAVSKDLSPNGPDQRRDGNPKGKKLVASVNKKDSEKEVRPPLFVSTAKSLSVSDVLDESKHPVTESKDISAVSENLSSTGKRRDNIGKAKVEELVASGDDDSGNEVVNPLLAQVANALPNSELPTASNDAVLGQDTKNPKRKASEASKEDPIAPKHESHEDLLSDWDMSVASGDAERSETKELLTEIDDEVSQPSQSDSKDPSTASDCGLGSVNVDDISSGLLSEVAALLSSTNDSDSDTRTAITIRSYVPPVASTTTVVEEEPPVDYNTALAMYTMSNKLGLSNTPKTLNGLCAKFLNADQLSGDEASDEDSSDSSDSDSDDTDSYDSDSDDTDSDDTGSVDTDSDISVHLDKGTEAKPRVSPSCTSSAFSFNPEKSNASLFVPKPPEEEEPMALEYELTDSEDEEANFINDVWMPYLEQCREKNIKPVHPRHSEKAMSQLPERLQAVERVSKAMREKALIRKMRKMNPTLDSIPFSKRRMLDTDSEGNAPSEDELASAETSKIIRQTLDVVGTKWIDSELQLLRRRKAFWKKNKRDANAEELIGSDLSEADLCPCEESCARALNRAMVKWKRDTSSVRTLIKRKDNPKCKKKEIRNGDFIFDACFCNASKKFQTDENHFECAPNDVVATPVVSDDEMPVRKDPKPETTWVLKNMPPLHYDGLRTSNMTTEEVMSALAGKNKDVPREAYVLTDEYAKLKEFFTLLDAKETKRLLEEKMRENWKLGIVEEIQLEEELEEKPAEEVEVAPPPTKTEREEIQLEEELEEKPAEEVEVAPPPTKPEREEIQLEEELVAKPAEEVEVAPPPTKTERVLPKFKFVRDKIIEESPGFFASLRKLMLGTPDGYQPVNLDDPDLKDVINLASLGEARDDGKREPEDDDEDAPSDSESALLLGGNKKKSRPSMPSEDRDDDEDAPSDSESALLLGGEKKKSRPSMPSEDRDDDEDAPSDSEPPLLLGEDHKKPRPSMLKIEEKEAVKSSSLLSLHSLHLADNGTEVELNNRQTVLEFHKARYPLETTRADTHLDGEYIRGEKIREVYDGREYSEKEHNDPFSALYDKIKPYRYFFDKLKPARDLFDKIKPSRELLDKITPSQDFLDNITPSQDLFDQIQPSRCLLGVLAVVMVVIAYLYQLQINQHSDSPFDTPNRTTRSTGPDALSFYTSGTRNLSRLVNAIHVQNGLISETISIDSLIAEVLKSDEAHLQSLLPLSDVTKTVERMKRLEKIEVQPVPGIVEKLELLEGYANHLSPELPESAEVDNFFASTQQVKEILQVVDELGDFREELTKFEAIENEQYTRAKTLEDALRNIASAAHVNLIRVDEISSNVAQLHSMGQTSKFIISMLDGIDLRRDLFDKYKNFEELKSSLSDLRMSSEKLDKWMDRSQNGKDIETLTSIGALLNSINGTAENTLLIAFPEVPSDFRNDITGDKWLKKVLNEGSDLTQLAEAMKVFQDVVPRLKKVEKIRMDALKGDLKADVERNLKRQKLLNDIKPVSGSITSSIDKVLKTVELLKKPDDFTGYEKLTKLRAESVKFNLLPQYAGNFSIFYESEQLQYFRNKTCRDELFRILDLGKEMKNAINNSIIVSECREKMKYVNVGLEKLSSLSQDIHGLIDSFKETKQTVQEAITWIYNVTAEKFFEDASLLTEDFKVIRRALHFIDETSSTKSKRNAVVNNLDEVVKMLKAVGSLKTDVTALKDESHSENTEKLAKMTKAGEIASNLTHSSGTLDDYRTMIECFQKNKKITGALKSLERHQKLPALDRNLEEFGTLFEQIDAPPDGALAACQLDDPKFSSGLQQSKKSFPVAVQKVDKFFLDFFGRQSLPVAAEEGTNWIVYLIIGLVVLLLSGSAVGAYFGCKKNRENEARYAKEMAEYAKAVEEYGREQGREEGRRELEKEHDPLFKKLKKELKEEQAANKDARIRRSLKEKEGMKQMASTKNKAKRMQIKLRMAEPVYQESWWAKRKRMMRGQTGKPKVNNGPKESSGPKESPTQLEDVDPWLANGVKIDYYDPEGQMRKTGFEYISGWVVDYRPSLCKLRQIEPVDDVGYQIRLEKVKPPEERQAKIVEKWVQYKPYLNPLRDFDPLNSDDLRSANTNSLSTQAQSFDPCQSTRSDVTVWPTRPSAPVIEGSWYKKENMEYLWHLLALQYRETKYEYLRFKSEEDRLEHRRQQALIKRKRLEKEEAEEKREERERDLAFAARWAKYLQKDAAEIALRRAANAILAADIKAKTEANDARIKKEKKERTPQQNVEKYVSESYLEYPMEEKLYMESTWESVDVIDNYIQSSIQSKWEYHYRCHTSRFIHDWCRVRMSKDDRYDIDFYDAGYVLPYYEVFKEVEHMYRNRLIVAATPMFHVTIGVLWHWLYENNVKLLVMISDFLERGVMYSKIYFPLHVGHTKRFKRNKVRQYEIKCLSCRSVGKDYLGRPRGYKRNIQITLVLNKQRQPPKVLRHVQMLDWQQNSIPRDYKMYVKLCELLDKESLDYPAVVMSMHGSGRAMTIILSLMAAKLAPLDDDVGIHAMVHGGRASKRNALNCREQVLFWRYVHYELLFRRYPSCEQFRVGDHELRDLVYLEAHMMQRVRCRTVEMLTRDVLRNYEKGRYLRYEFMETMERRFYAHKRVFDRKKKLHAVRKLAIAPNPAQEEPRSQYLRKEIRRKLRRLGDPPRDPNRPKKQPVADIHHKHALHANRQLMRTNPLLKTQNIRLQEWVKTSPFEEGKAVLVNRPMKYRMAHIDTEHVQWLMNGKKGPNKWEDVQKPIFVKTTNKKVSVEHNTKKKKKRNLSVQHKKNKKNSKSKRAVSAPLPKRKGVTAKSLQNLHAAVLRL